MNEMRARIFPAGPGFGALAAAQLWCFDHNFIYGGLQRGAPVGVHRASRASRISKWRDMDSEEHDDLDGRMEAQLGGSFRGDGVILTLRTDLIPPEDLGLWT